MLSSILCSICFVYRVYRIQYIATLRQSKGEPIMYIAKILNLRGTLVKGDNFWDVAVYNVLLQ